MKLKKLFLMTGILFTIALFCGISANAALTEETEGIYAYTVSVLGTATITDCDSSASGDITIPSNMGGYPVASIIMSAFAGCKSITSITMPEGLTSIGDYAFENCTGLKSITIPNSVTGAGVYAFSRCSNLTNIKIPDGWNIIREGTFAHCSNLKSIQIPMSVKQIGVHAFQGCNSLTDVYYYGSETDWNNIEIIEYQNDCLINANIHFITNECDILSIISPEGGTITDKTIDFKVASNMSEVTPEFELSAGATWDLYSAATATKPLPSKTVIIPRGGITITYYVKVTAADKETVNTYTVNFYRNTKSISPVITASRDKVTITVANCDIYYTTDGSPPTIESKKYIGVFSAPSKATIKAIAVETGKDEISDVVVFEVPEYLTTTMTGLYCYDMIDGTCYYSIMIQSDGVPTGEFIVAIYDIDGRLIGIKSEPRTIDKEETITDIVEVSGKAHTYKAFFWNSLEDLVPLCNNAEGTVIK